MYKSCLSLRLFVCFIFKTTVNVINQNQDHRAMQLPKERIWKVCVGLLQWGIHFHCYFHSKYFLCRGNDRLVVVHKHVCINPICLHQCSTVIAAKSPRLIIPEVLFSPSFLLQSDVATDVAL